MESYTGNYSDYQRQKADKLQAQDRAAARQEREIARQERFIERFRAKATKATAVQSRERQISKIERISRTRKEAAVTFSLEATGRTERDVLVCSGVSHAYGENLVLLGVDLHVERSQKVVLVGPNGSGKSTLLKIAAGDLPPSEGNVEWAGRAIRAYYDQHQDEALDPDRTVLEEVATAAPGQPEDGSAPPLASSSSAAMPSSSAWPCSLVENAAASPSPSSCSSPPTSCSSTSRPTTSIAPPAASSSRRLSATTARSSARATIPPSSSASPPASTK